jgi:hypothetical protein
MVTPDHFGFNSQTAETNPFMHTPDEIHKNTTQVQESAMKEFKHMISVLCQHEINVLVLPSPENVRTPDAVFPNNWFSHHSNGTLVLYPMLMPNRRAERQKENMVGLLEANNIKVSEIVDLTNLEENDVILESTGSMVLDREQHVAFAMASPRTMQESFEAWCKTMGYEGVYIVTPKSHRLEVYHTNLLMSIGTKFSVVCFEVIEDGEKTDQLKQKLEDLHKDVIAITLEQVYAFCGNILEVQSTSGEKKIIMSEGARDAFTKEQLDRLTKYGEIVAVPIPTIEKIGGGGVRCMMAEVFPE